MSKQCLSHFHIESGTWIEKDGLPYIDTSKSVDLKPLNTVVIHEVAHSGHVLVTRSGESSSSHSHGGGHKSGATVHSGPTTLVLTDTQIYVSVIYLDESSTFLSAPLRTPVEFSDVLRLELHFVFMIGPPGWKKSEWASLVNAHLVYEEKKGT
jgi:hypothetical protein